MSFKYDYFSLAYFRKINKFCLILLANYVKKMPNHSKIYITQKIAEQNKHDLSQGAAKYEKVWKKVYFSYLVWKSMKSYEKVWNFTFGYEN